MNSKRIIKTAAFLLICLGAVAFVNRSMDGEEPIQLEENVKIGKANFAISHGHCNLGFSGDIEQMVVQYPNSNPRDLKVDFKVNTKSLKVPGCGNGLSAGIQSEEMFDGSGSNYIQFRTDDVFVLAYDWYQLRGIMTIKGVDKVARLRATPVRDGNGLTKWILEGTIDLDAYGIQADTGGAEANGHVMFINLSASQDGC
ncbi:MAG: polyisoprenoid-binding protein YceI [Bacteroidia bacterium]|jgi:polyisoprenoid-binding protein YceI